MQFQHVALSNPIECQLSQQVSEEQKNAGNCLLKIIGCIKFLARQGLAMRGHAPEKGNLNQLLMLRAEDDPILQNWLTRKKHMTHSDIQNEILEILSHTIIRNICNDINTSEISLFSIIIDGTKDISGSEQLSICVRYVDKELHPREEFLGLYVAEYTTGENIANIIFDVLERLQLPLTNLRGQAFDGAANMSGQFRGVQVRIRERQPLAIFVHCGAHCVNLVSQAIGEVCVIVRDAMSNVHELGVLLSQNGKFKVIFKTISKSKDNSGIVKKIRPLCPTRFIHRTKELQAVLTQLEMIISALQEMSNVKTESAAKANGLLDRFQDGNTVLGLLMALKIMEPLETLNQGIQGRNQTVSGMTEAVKIVQSRFAALRSEQQFRKVFQNAEKISDELNLEEIKLPRKRQPTKRYCGQSENHDPAPFDKYCQGYFEMLDTASVQLSERFDNQSGLESFKHMEDALLKGDVSEEFKKFPEIDYSMLKIQIPMFRAQYSFSSIDEVAEIYRALVPEVKNMFKQIEVLLRLLLTVPSTSCEAERSFSALRRLKTYLRNNMGQVRLNAVAVCHVQQDRLDSINLKSVAKEFIYRKMERKRIFGKFAE